MNLDIDRFKKIRTLVTADLMTDEYLWGRVERISPEAPVPIGVGNVGTATPPSPRLLN